MGERAELSRGPTYEQARAELGGAPWREVPKSTDAWYILDEEAAALPAPRESRRLRFAVVGIAVVASAALLFFVARSHAHAAPLPAAVVAAPAPPAAAAPVAPAPVLQAPTAAPIAVAAAPARTIHSSAHARSHHAKHGKHARR